MDTVSDADTFCRPPANCVVLLGPTAVGKTALGVRLARETGGEIVSADSRQVYRGLDIGSGKDLDEYTSGGVSVPFHLIDIADLSGEYNVFNYQQDFYRVFSELEGRHVLPVVVGGTGMYLDAVIRDYDLVPVPENPVLRLQLSEKKLEELDTMLLALRPELHSRSDLAVRDRVIRAIEIESFMRTRGPAEYHRTFCRRPVLRPLVIGTTLPRDLVRKNIARRLRERLDAGMVAEVSHLHDTGVTWERLERLGLEYKFVACYLQGKMRTEEDLFAALNLAIGRFAKRQETWFRGMEKKGVTIHWLPQVPDADVRFSAAMNIINEYI